MASLVYIMLAALVVCVLAWLGGFWLVIANGRGSWLGLLGLVLMLPLLGVTLLTIWRFIFG